MLTLGQFSIMVGAPRRWVQNVRAALRLGGPYTEEEACRLAFARAVHQACGMSLASAHRMAAGALNAWPERRVWTHLGIDGAVVVTVDLERFLADFAARRSLARNFYAERRRGRPRGRRGVALAQWYGVDLSLLRSSLKLTPAQRLQRLEEAARFFGHARPA